ncbi:toxin-antitoxin system HicB family antitoxin [Granulicoccus phenolivorans]|uniref:toxin-antitoxin system HicB family antitoxin n=1 Tax=Granulicoccus phenolivorans TaxID=266854 RepID=UPI000429E440|nr:toxin-antitoxin system HicB family antitoxin [Granulicoccus phenolivorans]
MQMSKYVNRVQEQLVATTALADENTQQVAQKLGASLESALRLALVEALSDAAVEASETGVPIEVRIVDGEPHFVPQFPEAPFEAPTGEDEATSRISLRLPESVKKRVDDAAEEDGLSVNAWITHAVVGKLRRGMRGGPGGGQWGSGPWGPPGRGPWGPGPWGQGPWGPPEGGPGEFRRGGRGGHRRGGRRGPRGPESWEGPESESQE